MSPRTATPPTLRLRPPSPTDAPTLPGAQTLPGAPTLARLLELTGVAPAALAMTALALTPLASPTPAAAQSSADDAATEPPAAHTATADVAAVQDTAARASPGVSDWRFPVGERAVYDVSVALGSVRAPRPLGEARLTVEARDTVDGTAAYRTSLEVEGGIPLVYRMDDRQVSWIAPDPIRSLRYEERLREGSYRRDRIYRLDQERGTYTRRDLKDGEWRPVEGETDVPMPPEALDEISFLYLVRTLSLEPGRSYSFERYFEEEGNPVELEVLRREQVRVPAGRFETVVVRPRIQAGGLFGEEGRAEVYLSDDDRRIIVKIESRMKAGRADFVLTDYSPGDAPDGDA